MIFSPFCATSVGRSMREAYCLWAKVMQAVIAIEVKVKPFLYCRTIFFFNTFSYIFFLSLALPI